MSILIKSAIIVDSKSNFNFKKKDIYIKDGVIVDIADSINSKSENKFVLKNLHVSRGWMDTSVSFGEPGYEERENISNGLVTAASSGFTSILLNPDCYPLVDNHSSVEFLRKKSLNTTTNIYPIANLTNNSNGSDLASLYDMKLAGAVGFGDYKKSIVNSSILKIALEYTKTFGGRVISFCQDEFLSKKGVLNESIVSTELVRLGMTDAVIFDENGTNVLPAQVLYKKNILTLRGSYRPMTNVNEEMFKKSLEEFLKEKKVKKEDTLVVFEITLSNLRSAGNIDDSDYLDRAKLLCSMGHMVMISNFSEYYKLVQYLTLYTKKQLGLTMGVSNFIEIFDEQYYDNLKGGILEAFGNIFKNNMKVYLYPLLDKDTGEIINSDNLILENKMKEFYKYFKVNNKIRDLEFNHDFLEIFSKDILKKIKNNEKGWENKVPKSISKMIIKNKMFGYK